jgi:3-methyladenine DNA glycosylase AlkD
MLAPMPDAASPTAADFTSSLEQLTTGRAPAMREVFALAKTMMDMPLVEVRALLASDEHLHRVGAVSVLDFRARRRQVTDQERAALYDLYVDKHDLIDTWDLVDRAAPHVVGGYLHDRDRAPLYELSRSSDKWRRRTSVVATWYFIRDGDLDDTFALADLLAHDPEEVVQAAVGGFVREAGKHDPQRLRSYLDRQVPGLPRTILRHATRHLPESERRHYRDLTESARARGSEEEG